MHDPKHIEISIEFQQQLIKALEAFNQDKSWFDSPFAIGLLTALSAIFATLLQRWLAFKMQERDSEIEIRLRLHTLQLEALKALSILAHEITPKNEPSPGADIYEWLGPIVDQMHSIVGRLGNFLKEHGHITPSLVCEHVESAINLANNHKWGPIEADNMEYEATKEEINAANDLINELFVAVNAFKLELGISDIKKS